MERVAAGVRPISDRGAAAAQGARLGSRSNKRFDLSASEQRRDVVLQAMDVRRPAAQDGRLLDRLLQDGGETGCTRGYFLLCLSIIHTFWVPDQLCGSSAVFDGSFTPTLSSAGIFPPLTVTEWTPAVRCECDRCVWLTSTDKALNNWKLNSCFLTLRTCFIYRYVEFTGNGTNMFWLESLSAMIWVRLDSTGFCLHRWCFFFPAEKIPQRSVASGFESTLIKSHYDVEPSRQHETVQRPDLNCLLLLGDVRLRQQGEKESNPLAHTRAAF